MFVTHRLRLRCGTRVHVQWPTGGGAATILVVFADGRDPEVVQPDLLVLTAFCTHVDEAIEVAEWSADHAADFGATAGLLLLAGAGRAARLAAGVALRARDRRWPAIAGQILVSPVLRPPPADESPYAAPLRARSFAGVAPATVVTTARDDGGRYAARLRNAGVAVDEVPGPGALPAAVAHFLERNT